MRMSESDHSLAGAAPAFYFLCGHDGRQRQIRRFPARRAAQGGAADNLKRRKAQAKARAQAAGKAASAMPPELPPKLPHTSRKGSNPAFG